MKKGTDEIISRGIEEFFKESYRKNDDAGGPWYKLGVDLTAKELPEEDRLHLLQNSRDRYWKTSEGHSILKSLCHYVIGKGITYHAEDELPIVQEKLDEFWNHPKNCMELRQKEIVIRVLRDGEAFIWKFVDLAGMTLLRFIEPSEIKTITKNPDDAEIVESYHREWTPKGGTLQKKDIPAKEIIHIKLGVDLDMDRGLPYLYPIIKRLVQLDQFIDSRMKRNKLMGAVLLEKILHGKGATSAAVSSIKDTSSDASSIDNVTDAAKKMPKDGSMVVHNEAIEYKWNTAQVGAGDCEPDGRLLKLSICAGANIPEFLLGDASNANYASTLVAESPFVRNGEDLQDTFEEYFKIIFKDVIQNLINAGKIPSNSTQTIVKERAWLAKIFPKFNKGLLKTIREALVDQEVKEPASTKTSVKIEFPSMIYRNIKEDSSAYQIQDSMGIVSKQTISGKLGYDFEKEQELIAGEAEIRQQQEADNYEVQRQAAIDAGQLDEEGKPINGTKTSQ